jgi:hypothetical protein
LRSSTRASALKIENFHNKVKILGWPTNFFGTFSGSKLVADSKNIWRNIVWKLHFDVKIKNLFSKNQNGAQIQYGVFFTVFHELSQRSETFKLFFFCIFLKNKVWKKLKNGLKIQHERIFLKNSKFFSISIWLFFYNFPRNVTVERNIQTLICWLWIRWVMDSSYRSVKHWKKIVISTPSIPYCAQVLIVFLIVPIWIRHYESVLTTKSIFFLQKNKST